MRLDDIIAAIEADGRAVLVVIERVAGSTPREAGAAMLVSACGVRGTIGGGAVEHRACAIARAMIAAGPEASLDSAQRDPFVSGGLDRASRAASDVDSVVTATGEPAGVDAAALRANPGEPAFAPQQMAFPLGPVLDQCCGGHMTLLFAPFARADLGRLRDAAAIAGSDERRRGEPARIALWPGGPVYAEPPRPRPVFVYGGGHVGAALVAALAPLPFEVRWIDARARGFLVPPPAGVESRLTPLPEEEALAAPADAFHVVLTHSHALDLEIVAAVLERDAFGFLGLIGSATKRALFARRLRERGIPAERLGRLTCPIGLPGLRDKRPAVIAASTAAQLLQIDAAGEAAQQRGDRTSAGRPPEREPDSAPTWRTHSPAVVSAAD